MTPGGTTTGGAAGLAVAPGDGMVAAPGGGASIGRRVTAGASVDAGGVSGAGCGSRGGVQAAIANSSSQAPGERNGRAMPFNLGRCLPSGLAFRIALELRGVAAQRKMDPPALHLVHECCSARVGGPPQASGERDEHELHNATTP